MNILDKIENIVIETDDMETYYIEKKDIIDLDLKTNSVLVKEPKELGGLMYDIIEDGLLVVNDLDSFLNFETGRSFNYKNEKITKLTIRDKEDNCKIFYVDMYENGEVPSQLIDINDAGHVFITIQDLYKGEKVCLK